MDSVDTDAKYPQLGQLWVYRGPGTGANERHLIVSVDKKIGEIITCPWPITEFTGGHSWIGTPDLFNAEFAFCGVAVNPKQGKK